MEARLSPDNSRIVQLIFAPAGTDTVGRVSGYKTSSKVNSDMTFQDLPTKKLQIKMFVYSFASLSWRRFTVQ